MSNTPTLSTLANLDAKPEKGAFPDPTALPNILAGKKKASVSMDNFRIRYQKLNMCDPSDIIKLEKIETRAIRDQGVYVLDKKQFLFMDQILILIQYMEQAD